MSSLVYFKFKASVKTDSIAFEGSVISVKDLKNSIRTKCCLYSQDFDLKLEDSNGKIYEKDEELIPKYASIIVRRVPKLNTEGNKKKPNIYETKKDTKLQIPYEAPGSNNLNLAKANIPEEEKIKLMMEKSSEIYSEKNYAVKAKPYHVPPPNYTCHKCGEPGHWIHNCPGVQDSSGKMIDLKSVKRPTGIPQDFLLEVNAGTPGAYLSKSGGYFVTIKDAEAHALGKRDKVPFSEEENPPYIPPEEQKHPSYLICPLCSSLLKDAVVVSCCGTTYCNDCVVGHVFDSQVKGTGKCPSCSSELSSVESSLVENTIVRKIINDLNNQSSDQQFVNDSVSSTNKNFVKNRRVLQPKQKNLSSNDLEGKENNGNDDKPHSFDENEDSNKNTNVRDDVHLNIDGSSVNNNYVISKHSSVPFNQTSLTSIMSKSNGPLILTTANAAAHLVGSVSNNISLPNYGLLCGPQDSARPPVVVSTGLIDSNAIMSSSYGSRNHKSSSELSLKDLIELSTKKILSKEEFERLKSELIESKRHRHERKSFRSRSRSRNRSGSSRYHRRHRNHNRSHKRDRSSSREYQRRRSMTPDSNKEQVMEKVRRREKERERKLKDRQYSRKQDLSPIKDDQVQSRGSHSKERLITHFEAKNLSRSPHASPRKNHNSPRKRSRSQSSIKSIKDSTESPRREDSMELTDTNNLKISKKSALQMEEGEIISNDGHKKKKSKKHKTQEEKEAKRLRKLARKEKRLAKARKKALKVIQSA